MPNVKFYPNLAIFPRQKFSVVLIHGNQNLVNWVNISLGVFEMQSICSNLTIQGCKYDIFDFWKIPELKS